MMASPQDHGDNPATFQMAISRQSLMPSHTHVMVCLPCLLLGGSEIATLALVRALVQGRYDVTVCCYYEYDAVMVDRFRQAGARVELLGLTRGSLAHLFSVLAGFFRSRRPDVVHVQYFSPGMVPILAARYTGVRHLFATIHDAGERGYGWKAKAMLRFSASLTDHFFSVSQTAEHFWFGAPGLPHEPSDRRKARHSTIYNCVDVQAIQAARRGRDRGRLVPEIPRDAKVVGIAGRVVTRKGHITLLQAMRLVTAQLPNAFLLVIGTGAAEAMLRQETTRLGLDRSVLWTGRVEPENLPAYYHLMDVMAMPSLWEGFGLTAAEAMAASKPVVGTDVSGLREVVEDGVTGFLVPVGDAEALAARLHHLLSDDSARTGMGRQSLDRVKRLFDVPAHNDRWLTAYASLLAEDSKNMAVAVPSE